MSDFSEKCVNVIMILICLIVFVVLVDIGLKNKAEQKQVYFQGQIFEFNNHEYIYFRKGAGTILHNPDCKFCKGADK